MSTKTVGIALVWFGAIALLGSLHWIEINISVLLSVALIVAGLSLKHSEHSMTCMVGGKCVECGKGKGHKCVGPDCAECK